MLQLGAKFGEICFIRRIFPAALLENRHNSLLFIIIFKAWNFKAWNYEGYTTI